MKKADKSKLWFMYLTCCAVLAFYVGYKCSRIARPNPKPAEIPRLVDALKDYIEQALKGEKDE